MAPLPYSNTHLSQAARVTFSLLDRPVQFLKGVGPKRAAAFARVGLKTARDLLYAVPRRYDDASTVQPINSLEVGMEANVIGHVRSKGIVPTRSGLRIFQAVLRDETGMITCSWPGQPWLDRKLEKGDLILVTGPVKFFHGRQIQPREMVVVARARDEDPGMADDSGRIFVSYPATEELPQWVLRSVFDANLDGLLERIDEEEYLSPKFRKSLGLAVLSEALTSLHRPQNLEEVESGRRRLAFDELFFLQLVQARARYQRAHERPGIRFERTNELIRPVHESLGYELTAAQARALREIYSDMEQPIRMNRLLQGDVGSGKTLVALFAMLLAAESGLQAALMAPTEILAEQHSRRLAQLVEPVGLQVDLLTGRMSAPERKAVLARLQSGDAGLVVGTHALFQESVDFARLGLVVVDEQHRFGVRQRMALGAQGENPDVLAMSATPIPRSLSMALYGDLDLSLLDESPPGRGKVTTLVRYPSGREKAYELMRRELSEGRQAYVVYPLVDDSEKVDLGSATRAHGELTTLFSDWTVGLLHGQLSSDEKYDVMRRFYEGDIQVLVATTVIEVGVDVSNATVMVVEHAERFGLSQLHQLRGRVGRGSTESYCVLIAQPGEVAADRLAVLRDTNDGFKVAAEDLRIRGQGDLFGARQHGVADLLRFADLSVDEPLLVEAQQIARRIVESDPELTTAANQRIKTLVETRYAEPLRLYEVG